LFHDSRSFGLTKPTRARTWLTGVGPQATGRSKSSGARQVRVAGAVPPKRWIVERTFAWLHRNRRLVVDYERKVQTSETFIEVAMIRLLLARLGQQAKHAVSGTKKLVVRGAVT
jgi:Transposase DDE domain